MAFHVIDDTPTIRGGGVMTVKGSAAAFCSLIVVGLSVSGCFGINPVDEVEDRSTTMNATSSDYVSLSIFDNIIKASRFEPLNFVSLTSFTGHNTLNMGLPSFNTPLTSPFAFDSTTLSGQLATDFQVSVLDDPGSYSALLQPSNPATIGLFIKAGYPRELIFILFVDYLTVHNVDNTTSLYYNLPEETAGSTSKHKCFQGTDDVVTSFDKTLCKIEHYVESGLTVDVDSDSSPQSSVIPSYNLCFDKLLPLPDTDVRGYRRVPFDQPPLQGMPKCGAPPVKIQGANQEGWTRPQSSDPTPMKGAEAHVPRPFYVIHQDDGAKVEIHTRSVLGVYQFLGELVKYHFDVKLRHADTVDTGLLEVNGDGNCYVSTKVAGANYCVPNEAVNTKKIFSLLRQITAILVRPSNNMATQTTRTIGKSM